MNYFDQQSQPVRGQHHGQQDHNQNPGQLTPLQFAGKLPPSDPASQAYFAGSNNPGYQHNNVMMPYAVPTITHAFQPLNGPPAGSPGPMFPNPLVGYPVAPLHEQPMGNHNVYQPTNHPGNYNINPAGPSSVDWTPPTNLTPPQIPTPTPPNPHLWHPTATNPLSPNTQVAMGAMFQQSLPPLFPQPPRSHHTGNTMGSPYSIHGSVAPPDPRLNHTSDPAVHPMYRDLRVQAQLKDPRNQPHSALINIRREKRVVLALFLDSDSHPISHRGWEGILLPQTLSVESGPVQQISPTKLLKLSIQVYACARGDVNVLPCNSCWSRERPPDPNVQPYMIDFKAQSRQIALSAHSSGNRNYLKADVKFHFTCYSRHHDGLYRLILKLHDASDNLVAHCSLPYKFVVRANGNDPGGYYETQEQTTAQQQTPLSVFPVPNPTPTLGTQSPVAPMNFHPVPVNQHLQPNPILSASNLQRLAPAEGPVSGGPTILLSGINFPHPRQRIVYARFGAVVVPTIWHNAHTLECKLPPSPTPGMVGVTLSLYQEPGGPEFGQSDCSFRYNLELDYIHALIRTISGQDHTLTPENWDAIIPLFVQKVSSAGRRMLHEATQPIQPMNPPFTTSAGEMEALTVQLLASFTNSPNWEDSISFKNEHHQTLAHLAVLFRYTTLLEKVAQWGINVDVQDVNGFTALHCAYLCGDLRAVQILQGYGADEDVQDSLGRRPSDMYFPRENIPRENGSPSSDRTADDWEKVSEVSSSFDECSPISARKDQQRDAGQSSTSSGIFPALVSMPSPTYGILSSPEELTNRFSEFGLSDSPTEMDQRSSQFPNVPVVQLCPSSSEALPPAQAHQCGHSYSSAPSPRPTPRLSVSEAQPPRGPEVKSSQEAIRSDNSPSTSPPPPTASVQMPMPRPFQHDTSGFQSPSLADLRTAHSSSSAASCHLSCTGTKPGLKSQPVTRPSSADPPKADPPKTAMFSPPSGPPPVTSGSGLTSVRHYVSSDLKLPPYDEGPKKFRDDIKLPFNELLDELEGSMGGPVKLSPGTEKQLYIPSEQKSKKNIDLHEGSRFCDLRPGDT